MSILSLENITFSFGKRKILDEISLYINKSSIISISGQSGSGKTTLLGIISGLLKPDSGKIFFKGKDIYRLNDFRRTRYRNREIGYVFQTFNLFSDLNAYQNIMYPAVLNRRAAGINKEMDYLIDYLNLSKIIYHYPDSLSGGEKQRIAIARAVINRPALLLADEPTGNLDDKNGKNIFSLFETLNKNEGINIIIVTHDKYIIRNSDVHYHLSNSKLEKKRKN